jgi:hypothetical protein
MIFPAPSLGLLLFLFGKKRRSLINQHNLSFSILFLARGAVPCEVPLANTVPYISKLSATTAKKEGVLRAGAALESRNSRCRVIAQSLIGVGLRETKEILMKKVE